MTEDIPKCSQCGHTMEVGDDPDTFYCYTDNCHVWVYHPSMDKDDDNGGSDIGSVDELIRWLKRETDD